MSERVLIVDDDANLLAGLRRHLRKRFHITTAEGGEEALKLVKANGSFAVAVCDMQMPGMNGIEVLGALKKTTPETVRIMLTGNADQQTAIDAVNEGSIFRFFNKPCPPEQLAAGIDGGLAQHRLITAERELLENTLAGSVKVLVDVLSMVAPDSFGKATKLRDWARLATPQLKLAQPWQLEMAALLSPIGEVAIPPELAEKRRAKEKLTAAEKDIIRRAPETARDLIANIPRMSGVAEIVYLQDKGYDGSGFPDDVPDGADIPPGARLLKVLKDLARISQGPYPPHEAFDKLERRAERYDAQILAACRKTLTGRVDKGTAVATHDEVPVSTLRPGYLLRSDLKLENGRLILAAGNRLTAAQVAQIKNLSELNTFREPVRVTIPAPSR